MDDDAIAKLYPVLKRIAQSRARGTTFGGTSLTHDALEKVMARRSLSDVSEGDRADFVRLVARQIHWELLDRLRRNQREAEVEEEARRRSERALEQKRKSGARLIEVLETLKDHAKQGTREEAEVETYLLHVYAGLTWDECAQLQKICRRTVGNYMQRVETIVSSTFGNGNGVGS